MTVPELFAKHLTTMVSYTISVVAVSAGAVVWFQKERIERLKEDAQRARGALPPASAPLGAVSGLLNSQLRDRARYFTDELKEISNSLMVINQWLQRHEGVDDATYQTQVAQWEAPIRELRGAANAKYAQIKEEVVAVKDEIRHRTEPSLLTARDPDIDAMYLTPHAFWDRGDPYSALWGDLELLVRAMRA